MDHRLGIGLVLPAFGDNENLGDGKNRRRHRRKISMVAGTSERHAPGRRI
jgi:hypothetical protein